MTRLARVLKASRNTVNEWLRAFEEVAQVDLPRGPRNARLVNDYLLTVVGGAMHFVENNKATWEEALREQLRLTGFVPPEPVDELAALRQANAVLQEQVHDARVHLRQAEETIQSYAELLREAREQLNLARNAEPEDQADPVTVPASSVSTASLAPSDPHTSAGDRIAIGLRRVFRRFP